MPQTLKLAFRGDEPILNFNRRDRHDQPFHQTRVENPHRPTVRPLLKLTLNRGLDQHRCQKLRPKDLLSWRNLQQARIDDPGFDVVWNYQHLSERANKAHQHIAFGYSATL